MSICAETEVRNVNLSDIRIDGGTQCRVALNEETVKEYAELLVGSFEFPPAIVYFDGSTYWMADGFHRYFAYQKAHFDAMPCEIIQGTKEDAQWHAYGANKGHGLRRTNADKQHAVEMALRHPRGAELSDRQIAEYVGVSHTMVASYRPTESTTGNGCQLEVRVGKDGKKRKTSSAKRSESAKKAKKKSGPQSPQPDNSESVSSAPEPEAPEESRKELEQAAECESVEHEPNEVEPVVEHPRELFDGLKRKVPEQFIEVFSVVSRFDELRTRLNEMKRDFQSLCGSNAGTFLHAQAIMAEIENLKQALKFAKPFSVCPYCKGSGCKACRHQGWVPQDSYRSAPEDMK